jgi:hypothetical protein
MSWLNNYTTDAECRKPILSLNLFAGNDLARLLECPLNGLASKLQELYGVRLTPDGVIKDLDLERDYLDAARREAYRVFFFSGRAFHYRRTSRKFVALHTNTDTMGNLMGVREGHGFVLSMSNKLYVGVLETLGLQYHSFFMGGRPVQCAGTMQFNQGAVTYVRNDSGHYQPVDQSMVKVLQLLRMNGMDLRRLTVGQEKKFQTDRSTDMRVRGDVFMRNNGNWNSILARADHQQPL